jgi:hypothetical protein
VSIDEISLSQSSRSWPEIFDDSDSFNIRHHLHRRDHPCDESLSSDPFSTDHDDSNA